MTEISDVLSGATLEGKTPTQIVRVEAGRLARLLARATHDRPFLTVACDPLKTEPGDRLALYEASTGRGVVALADAHSGPSPDPESGAAAWCVLTELANGPTRQQLVAAGLESARRRARPAVALSEDEQAALAAIIVPLPLFATNADRVPGEPATMRLRDVDDDELWANEKEMQLALAADREALQSLGLPLRPVIEERFDGGRMRFDLSGPSVVVECKLFGTLDGVNQVQRYIDARRATGETCRGHLVVGFGYTRDVAVLLGRLAKEAEATDTAPDVELSLCLKRPGGGVLVLAQTIDSVAWVTVRDQIREQLEALLHAVTRIAVDARDLAVDAGLDPDALLGDEESNEPQDDLPDIEELPLDQQGPRALKDVLLLLNDCNVRLFEMAEAAGMRDDDLDDVAARNEQPSSIEPADSTFASLEGIAHIYVELLAMLMNYATTCGLPWGSVRQLHNELAPEDLEVLDDVARDYYFARGNLDLAMYTAVPLARAAGLSEKDICEASAEAIALTGLSEAETGDMAFPYDDPDPR